MDALMDSRRRASEPAVLRSRWQMERGLMQAHQMTPEFLQNHVARCPHVLARKLPALWRVDRFAKRDEIKLDTESDAML